MMRRRLRQWQFLDPCPCKIYIKQQQQYRKANDRAIERVRCCVETVVQEVSVYLQDRN